MVPTTPRTTRGSDSYKLVVLLLLMISRAARSMSTSTGRSKVVLHWFRHGDLRLHDNQALAHSLQQADVCIPIFCFDPKVFGDASRTPHHHLKVGPKRAKFILESVADLRASLQARGSGICVTHEDPATFFGRIVESLKDSDVDIRVSVQEEVLKEEKDAVQAVQAAIRAYSSQVKVDQIWGSTMYELEDLPFDEHLQTMPDIFTPFRNKVEKNCKIGIPLPPPKEIPLPSSDSTAYKLIEPYLSSMPSLTDLAYTEEQIDDANTHDPRGVMEFKGGETAALARVKDYIWTKDRLKIYFETRNGMLGADYSTKLSPWLAHGCISPREVALQCRRYEEERVANKSTYWVVFELLWRDFCKFFCAKHGDKVFSPNGTAGKPHNWSTYDKNFSAWKEGRTGYPLVDANMREMAASGFMSNRGRQNVASFLALDLNHDWRMGGDWFESALIDYDVYSNWVSWCIAAGQTGGRINRFNTVKQSKDYDQHGDYVRHWIPELTNVPNEFVHEPWKMNQDQQAEFGVNLGVDYPVPIIPPFQPKYGGNKSNGGNTRRTPQMQRKKNSNKHNRHQQHEMKSVKQGTIDMK